ncbi:MAG: nuclear transport factor 2 family protein [Flammeovirgaceae bacterium]
MSRQSEKTTITEIIDTINESWLFQDFNQLASYLHDDVVFVKPDFSEMICGIEACVASYREFMKDASVNRFFADKVNICFWEDTANAYYEFEIEYESENRVTHEKAIDLFTLRKQGETWKVIWRSVANIKVLGSHELVSDH